MTVHLRLLPEIEARLREQAAAAGKDVNSFVQDLLLASLDAHPARADGRRNGKKDADWNARLDDWIAGFEVAPADVGDGRDSIYSGRGE
jgi:hypothetical protein